MIAAAASRPRAMPPGKPSATSGSTQHKDGKESGSWDWLDFGLRPWEAGEATYYGTTLAAIAIGTAPGYLKTDHDADTRAGVERLRKYLSSHLEKQNLHNQLFALWASKSIVGMLSEAQRQQIIDQVVAEAAGERRLSLAIAGDCKRQDGTPQEKHPDGYATGLQCPRSPDDVREGRDKPAVRRSRGSAPISRRRETGSASR